MGNQPSVAPSLATPSTLSKHSSTTNSRPKKNVTFASTNQVIDDDTTSHNNNKDQNEYDKDILLARVEQENQFLRDRCERLEAQAILVSVQQLDYLAQCIAWTLYLGALCLIGKLVLVFVPSSVNRQFVDKYVLLPFCWKITCDFSCQVTSDGYCENHEKLVFLVLDMCWTIIKYGLGASLGFLYHRSTHGLDLRRCHVFAVAMIMFARIKLCRERERMFVARHDLQTTATGDVNDSAAEPGNETSSSLPPSEYGGSDDRMTTITEEAIWDANYEVSARFLYLSFLRLRGLWIKTAQYLSSRADFVPAAYVRELSKLQDQAPTTPWNDILRHGIIPSSVLRIFDVDPIPIASASIGQVHVARCNIKTSATNQTCFTSTDNDDDDENDENVKLVVKVQHPFAKTLLLDDFRSLAWICRIWSFLEPEYKFFEILMQEWAMEARKELDFLQEAQNLVEAQISLMMEQHQEDPSKMKQPRKPQHPFFVTATNGIPYNVEIPQPILALCTRRVLVMSFCEGVRIDKCLDEFGSPTSQDWRNIPKEDVMESVAQTFAQFMYNGTIFNADPHPGNLFIRPGINHRRRQHHQEQRPQEPNEADTDKSQTRGFTLVVLDWGLAKRLPPMKRLAFAQMAYAAATIDFGLLLDSFDLLGLKMKREDVHQDMDAIRFLLRELAPRSIARSRLKAKIRQNQEKMKLKKRGERVPVESKAYPGEFFFFVRVNELLHGLGSRLQVQLNYLDIIKPYAEHALLHASSANRPAKESITCDDRPIIDSVLNDKIGQVLREMGDCNQIAGAQVCVLDSDGNALVDLAVGHRGGYMRNIAMRHSTLVLGFSCTKAVAATLAHVMVAEGYLTPDEPISERVWVDFCPSEQPPPELFAALRDTLSREEIAQRWAWKRKITLRHILTHSAGLWSALPPSLNIQRLSCCDSCVAAFEYDPLNPAETILPNRIPGEKGEYHFLSFGWLVAGVLCGAYKERHGRTCSFEEIYQAILAPKLSPITLSSGFKPNGCDNCEDSLALVEIDNSKTGLIFQVEREAGSMGQDLGYDNELLLVEPLLPALKGREFLIDPRIWNCKTARGATCPAAGGRFSARGLANFYHDLSRNGLLSKERLEWASSTHIVLDNGRTMMNSSRRPEQTMFGLGYQLVTFDGDEGSAPTTPSAFGHAGVGGSIGFHHKPSGLSVAVMLNKADGDVTKKIVTIISEHFGWKN